MNPDSFSLASTGFEFPGQTNVYHGKVRDVYTIGEKLVMVASDRISAFDHILPRAIPYKGQVLNQLAVHFLEATRDIVPNWLLNSPDPNVSVGLAASPFKAVSYTHLILNFISRENQPHTMPYSIIEHDKLFDR